MYVNRDVFLVWKGFPLLSSWIQVTLNKHAEIVVPKLAKFGRQVGRGDQLFWVTVLGGIKTEEMRRKWIKTVQQAEKPTILIVHLLLC